MTTDSICQLIAYTIYIYIQCVPKPFDDYVIDSLHNIYIYSVPKRFHDYVIDSLQYIYLK